MAVVVTFCRVIPLALFAPVELNTRAAAAESRRENRAFYAIHVTLAFLPANLRTFLRMILASPRCGTKRPLIPGSGRAAVVDLFREFSVPAKRRRQEEMPLVCRAR